LMECKETLRLKHNFTALLGQWNSLLQVQVAIHDVIFEKLYGIDCFTRHFIY
jgi:hypothetical protein